MQGTKVLVNNMFILQCRENATIFTQFFSQQCSLVRNNSLLPNFSYFTNEKLSNIRLTTDYITRLILSLNPNKALIKFPPKCSCSNETVVLPLNIIFSNILQTCIYPDIWNLANVTLIF